MATIVHPDYTGVLTLELENLGEVPITLYSGARIYQLIFHEVKGNKKIQYKNFYFENKYIACTSLAFSRIYKDIGREKLRFFYNKIESANLLFAQFQ